MGKSLHISPPPVLGLSIVEENLLPGVNPNEIMVGGVGDLTNLGFARQFSVDVGEELDFSCDGDGEIIDLYRMGWYGGQGWAYKGTLDNTPTDQPNPAVIPNSNNANTCTAWSTTAQWEVPIDATPGFYMGVFRNAALDGASHIPFVIRNDARQAEIMLKMADTTWALAYNYYGTPASPLTGGSFYGSGGPIGAGGIGARVHAATYHKPIITREGVQNTWNHIEAPLIRYLERMGYDVNYCASKDWREGGSAPDLALCNIYIATGHDEYWDQGMRDKWETLRDTGKHLLFMSGNEVFWRTRFPDDQGDVMWCYKDTMDGPGGHVGGVPLDPVSWTGTWRDTRRPGGPEGEWHLTGTDFRMNGILDRALVMAPTDPPTDHVFWRNTDVSINGINRSAVIGGEADELRPMQPVDSYRILAQSVHNIDNNRADDNGESYGNDGDLNWGIVSQRYTSGSVVVGFGTWQWGWGLDATHDRGSNISNIQMQQATANLLVDLGSLPGTPFAGITVPTPASLDEYGLVP